MLNRREFLRAAAITAAAAVGALVAPDRAAGMQRGVDLAAGPDETYFYQYRIRRNHRWDVEIMQGSALSRIETSACIRRSHREISNALCRWAN